MKTISKKRIITSILSMLLVLFLSVPVMAQANESLTVVSEFDYEVYDSNDNLIETGKITDSDDRASWGGITIPNGGYASLTPSQYIQSGRGIRFNYNLDRSATMEVSFIKEGGYAWWSHSYSGVTATALLTSDESTYYYVQLRNTSPNTVVVTSATLTF